MNNMMKRAIAFLITLLLIVNILPASAPADTGEYGQLNLKKSSRPFYIDIQLEEEQDWMTLEKMLAGTGETISDSFYMYYAEPDTLNVNQYFQEIDGLTSIPQGETGEVWIYDWSANNGNGEWVACVTFIPPVISEKKFYSVEETGTFTQADILDAAGVTQSKYDQYYLMQDDSTVNYSDYITVHIMEHTVEFQTTNLPNGGLVYKLAANGGDPCPFKLVFIGVNDDKNANDGLFTYKLDDASGTATITGFVNGLSDEQKADIIIPATMTWPKTNGTEYQVTGMIKEAFKSDTHIHTVTINAPIFTIGDYAFCDCSSLTQIKQTVGGADSRLTIGEHAFDAEEHRNSNLKVFTSEAGVDNIGAKAFAFADKLVTFRAGNSRKTEIGTNAFQNCSGDLSFNGGIKNLGYLSFYNTKINTIRTTSIEYAWYSIWEPISSQIDLVLNVSKCANGTLTKDILTGSLLKYVSGFNNIIVNLEYGTKEICSGVFDSFSFDNYDSVTLNINTKENDSKIKVAEDAIPADQSKIQINFRVNRANVTGADVDPLPALEAIGRITYLDSGTLDTHYHDSVFMYELDETNKAYIVGLYNTTDTGIAFTSSNQGDVYDSNGQKMEGMSLNVAGITVLSDTEKARIQSIVFNHSKQFTVAENVLNNMPALEQITIDKPNLRLPENAFSSCPELKKVTMGSESNQNGSMDIPARAFAGCSSLKEFTARFNVVHTEASAFNGCTALETVSFEGYGSQDIKAGTFADAKNIRILRIDNPYDVEDNAFAVENGTSFIQNTDTSLNDNLTAKIGDFENYIFLNNPWWMNGNAFSDNSTATKVYFANTSKNLTSDLVSVITNAGKSLTDVYIDCERTEVSFADSLDTANPHVRIHYRDNDVYTGLYIDGVDGDDENGDGSKENPYRSFCKVKAILEALPDESFGNGRDVKDEGMTNAVTTGCASIGLNVTPGTFTDHIYADKMAFVLNTITVSENDAVWSSGDREEIMLIRDPEFTGTMVEVNGQLSLEHVILDGNRTQVTAEAPIINVKKNATLNLGEGSVLRNNAYPDAYWDGYDFINGGAVFANTATVNILNGCMIDNNLAQWGGGIQMFGGTLNMTGGTISNNTAKARYSTDGNRTPFQGNGGGILLMHGAVMNLSGGSVIQNHAEGYAYTSQIGINGSTGGGIQVGAYYNDVNSNTQLFMTGGTVSNNVSHAEGGGICIQDSCTATITRGYIIGNETKLNANSDNFGGGGIYVNAARSGSRNGLLKLNNVLITDNEAIEGGAIACCETVNLTLAMGNGAAIYGNHAPAGHGYDNDLLLFYRGGWNGGTKAKLSPYMMNGAKYNWTHVVTNYDKDVHDSPFDNGEPLSKELNAYMDVSSVGCDVKLKSNPADTSANAAVIISGNKSAYRGGGIGSNGNIIIGDVPPANDVTLNPIVSKLVVGRDMKEGEEFAFSVYEEKTTNKYQNGFSVYSYQDTLVGHGSMKMGKDGVLSRIDLPSYTIKNVNSDMVGNKYTLLVTEDTGSTDAMSADEHTYFALHYVIGQGKNNYQTYMYQIEVGTYTRDENGVPVFNYGEDRVPGYVPFLRRIRKEIQTNDAVFTNYLLDRSASAKKVWQQADGIEMITPEDAYVTFELLADGEQAKDLTGKTVPPITLDGETDRNGEKEAWTAFWDNLPVFADDTYTRKIVYTVKETACSPESFTAKEAEVQVPDNAEAVIINIYQSTETPTPTPTPEETPTPTITESPSPSPTTTPDVPEPEEVSVSVSKVWDDMENLDGSRPGSIRMTLLADGTELQTVVLNEGNAWSAEVTGLPLENAQGIPIMYTWHEENVAGYTGKAEVDGNETIFTNTHVPELTSVSVRKIWDDNNDENRIRPEQIIMRLSNGMTVALNAKNNWTATIDNLPALYEGKKIEYTWTEQEVIGYNEPTVEKTGTMTVFTNSIWKRPEGTPTRGKTPDLPGKPTEILEDYGTPLGIEVLINHVGDCFD